MHATIISRQAARVQFQLDYHLGSQFAGLIVAQQSGIYAKRGLVVDLLAAPSPGAEPTLVRQMQEEQWKTDTEALVIGCVEQNTLIAAQLYGREPLKAVSAMLHSTPLAIATAPDRGIHTLQDLAGKSVAAADDTAEIIRNALSDCDPGLPDQVSIVAMDREEKLPTFRAGKVDAMQVYTTTEAFQLQSDLGAAPVLLPFGERHGYAQVVFAHEAALTSRLHRTILRAFLDATYEGWSAALRAPQATAEAVAYARESAGVRGVEGGHSDTHEFHLASLMALADFVAPTPGYALGTIDLGRFMAASDQIALDLKHQTHFMPSHSDATHWQPGGLLLASPLIDTSLWPQPQLMRGVTAQPHREGVACIDGQGLADRRRREIQVRAERFAAFYGRQACLGVVEVLPEGEQPTNSLSHPARKECSPNSQRGSWLDKHRAGRAMGVAVERVLLPGAATMQEVVAAIRGLNRREDVDGVLMELPDKLLGLTSQLDVDQLLAEVAPHKCVDGMTPRSIAALLSDAASGTRSDRAVLATTPGSVLSLLEGAGVRLAGRHAVVLGNSRLCGQPIALLLQKEGAAVSVVTSSTPGGLRDDLCSRADVVVSCVGSPGILSEANLRPGAVVVNVGTQLDSRGGHGCTLRPDVELATPMGQVLTPTPGGVGPNPVMALFENVLCRAEQRAAGKQEAEERGKVATTAPGDVQGLQGWQVHEGECLRKAFTAPTFEAAASMLQDVAVLSAEINHHPLVTLGPAECNVGGHGDIKCFNHGCVISFELRSLEAGSITEADVLLARAIDLELQ